MELATSPVAAGCGLWRSRQALERAGGQFGGWVIRVKMPGWARGPHGPLTSHVHERRHNTLAPVSGCPANTSFRDAGCATLQGEAVGSLQTARTGSK